MRHLVHRIVRCTAATIAGRKPATLMNISNDNGRLLGISKENRSTTIQLNGNDVALVYAEPLGADQLIADLAYKRALEALE